MLTRSLKVSPSLLLLIILLAFCGWQLSQGQGPQLQRVESALGFQTSLQAERTGKPRIAIMTFVTDQKSYVHLSLKSKDHYARRHGYDFIVDFESHTSRNINFWKFTMAERLIRTGKYDWIWWLDFDTLFTNTDIKVTDIIEDELRNLTNRDEIDYLHTHDCNGFNGGSWLVRGHTRSIKFLHDSKRLEEEAKSKDVHMNDQDVFVKLIKDDPASAARVHVVPQWKLNAYPSEISCFDKDKKVWEHGTFVVHFAGAWAHVKGDDPTGQLMEKYGAQIIWGDWKDFY